MWGQAEQALNQSMTRVVSQFAILLPGIVALIVAVLVSAVVAWVLAVVVGRSLASLRFDEKLAHSGFAAVTEWSPSHSPSLLVARVAAWVAMIAGILIGVTAFDAAWTTTLMDSLAAYLPNVIGAVLVLLAGNIAARFLARSVLIGAVNWNLQYARLLSVGAKWLVNVLSIAMALDHLRIGAGIVRLAFGILFGGKELVSRSLERETPVPPSPPTPVEEPFRHI